MPILHPSGKAKNSDQFKLFKDNMYHTCIKLVMGGIIVLVASFIAVVYN